MTGDTPDNIFEKYDSCFIEFGEVRHKLHARRDIHAFLLLDQLLPGTRKIIAGADHDEIYLDADPDALWKVATEEQLRDLHRCGVRHDSNHGICMFA